MTKKISLDVYCVPIIHHNGCNALGMATTDAVVNFFTDLEKEREATKTQNKSKETTKVDNLAWNTVVQSAGNIRNVGKERKKAVTPKVVKEKPIPSLEARILASGANRDLSNEDNCATVTAVKEGQDSRSVDEMPELNKARLLNGPRDIVTGGCKRASSKVTTIAQGIDNMKVSTTTEVGSSSAVKFITTAEAAAAASLNDSSVNQQPPGTVTISTVMELDKAETLFPEPAVESEGDRRYRLLVPKHEGQKFRN